MALADRFFRNVSIRWKVVGVILGVAAVSLLLAGAGMLWSTRATFERQTEQKLFLLADVIGMHSVMTLAERDAGAASDALSALRSDPNVIAGALYDAQGRLFARYARADQPFSLPLELSEASAAFDRKERIGILRPMQINGRSVGAVYLVAADATEWRAALWRFLGVLGAIFGVVLAVSLLASIWLQPLITQPITELVALMRRVSNQRDYSGRARKRGNDELGALVDGFNDMLGEVEKRRAEVEQAQGELRQRVTELDAEVIERRRAEAELRYASDQLKNFIENANVGLHWVGPDGVILWANRYELQMLGYSADEYIGRPIADFYVERKIADDLLKRLHEGEVVDNFEAAMRHKNGSVMYVLVNESVYWEDGRFVHTRCFTRDITDRKRAEERFRLAVEAAPNAMLMVNQAGEIVLANNEVEVLFGYQRDELLGRSVEMLVPENVRAHHPQYRAGFMSDPHARPMGAGRDLYGRHKSGQLVPVEIGLSPFATEEGVFTLAVVIDITERKRAEDALRQSEERYRTLVAATSSVVFTDDASGRSVKRNTAWESYTGQSFEEYRKHGWLAKVHPDDQIAAGASWERALREGEAYNMEARVWHVRSQTHRYCVFRAIPLRHVDGTVREWVGTMTDIDDRKRADERFRLAVEAAPNAMVMIDPQGNIVLANRQLEALFGYTREELLGHPVEMLVPERSRRTHPAFRADFFADPGTRVMGAGRDLFGRHKDGRHILVEIGLNPFTTADGVFCLASIIDITARKRAEQELHRYTDELQRSNRELAQFAYVASHDLQEPLRAISGCVQLLQQRYQGRLDARADDLIQHAVSGAARMQALINDLLSYSRVGTRAKPFESVDLVQPLQEAMANLSVAIKEAGAVITWDEMPITNADPTQFTQLFQNLISNALKFRGTDRTARIHVGVERQGAGQIVFVRDNGIGIEPQYFERIFGVFQRLHSRNKYPGNGIGLAICRKIVERHGGRMWLESASGQGSTFYFTIPDGGGHNEQQPERQNQPQQYH